MTNNIVAMDSISDQVMTKVIAQNIADLEKLKHSVAQDSMLTKPILRIYHWAHARVNTINISHYSTWLLSQREHLEQALSFFDELINELPYVIGYDNEKPYLHIEMRWTYFTFLLPQFLIDNSIYFDGSLTHWWDNLYSVIEHAQKCVQTVQSRVKDILH